MNIEQVLREILKIVVAGYKTLCHRLECEGMKILCCFAPKTLSQLHASAIYEEI